MVNRRPVPNELSSLSKRALAKRLRVPSRLRAVTISVVTKTWCTGGKCGPLQVSDGSKRPPIAASAKEETSDNLANFAIASLRPQPEHACCTVQTMWRVSWQSRSCACTSLFGNVVVAQAIAGKRFDMFEPCGQRTIIGGEPSERRVRQYRSTRCACQLTVRVRVAGCRVESGPYRAGWQVRSSHTSA